MPHVQAENPEQQLTALQEDGSFLLLAGLAPLSTRAIGKLEYELS
jgi:hypothetical protein